LTSTCDLFCFVYHLSNRAGDGNISTHRRCLIGSCHLNLPILNLEMRLGVTTSPHISFPTGSRHPINVQGDTAASAHTFCLLHQFVNKVHSKHTQASTASSVIPSKIGRTISDIHTPNMIDLLYTKAAQQTMVYFMTNE